MLGKEMLLMGAGGEKKVGTLTIYAHVDGRRENVSVELVSGVTETFWEETRTYKNTDVVRISEYSTVNEKVNLRYADYAYYIVDIYKDAYLDTGWL